MTSDTPAQPADVIVGLAASGRTPYVLIALRYARTLGYATVGVFCNLESPIAQAADIAISPAVGSEVLISSTRMKSGTVQKLVLNMIPTDAMVKLSRVYQNLMVDVKATNVKLCDRTYRIVCEACGIDVDTENMTLNRLLAGGGGGRSYIIEADEKHIGQSRL